MTSHGSAVELTWIGIILIDYYVLVYYYIIGNERYTNKQYTNIKQAMLIKHDYIAIYIVLYVVGGAARLAMQGEQEGKPQAASIQALLKERVALLSGM